MLQKRTSSFFLCVFLTPFFLFCNASLFAIFKQVEFRVKIPHAVSNPIACGVQGKCLRSSVRSHTSIIIMHNSYDRIDINSVEQYWWWQLQLQSTKSTERARNKCDNVNGWWLVEGDWGNTTFVSWLNTEVVAYILWLPSKPCNSIKSKSIYLKRKEKM